MAEQLSTVQFERRFGMSKQLILYYINNNKKIPGVASVEKIAGRYILTLKKNKKELLPNGK